MDDSEIPLWLYSTDEDEEQPATMHKWCLVNELKFTDELTVKRIYALAGAVHRSFVKAGILYWTCGGTTLGCIRHQGLIPWDDDLDVCIYQNDESSKLSEANDYLNNEGFEMVEAPTVGYRIFHKTDSGTVTGYPFCDVFVMKPMSCGKCCIADRCGRVLWPDETYYIRDTQNTQQKPFGDLFLNCPSNAESYLDRCYGADWRVEGATHCYDHVSKTPVKPVKFALTKELCQPAKPFH